MATLDQLKGGPRCDWLSGSPGLNTEETGGLQDSGLNRREHE